MPWVSLESTGISAHHLPQFNTHPAQKTFHHFIPSKPQSAAQAWEKFTSLFVWETKEIIYLKKLLKAETIHWKAEKETLATMLSTAPPYGVQGHLLTALIKRCDPIHKKEILELTFDKMFACSDFKFEKIIKLLDAQTLNSGSAYNALMEEIKEMAECLPLQKQMKSNGAGKEVQKTIIAAGRFFQHFLDTILKAFNLIDVGKGPESVWDFAAMMQIYFKIFLVPQAIFVTVGALVSVGWQVFAITAAIVVLGVVGICLYLKYRPCPNKLLRARNLSEEAENGKLQPVIGREKEIQKIGSYLGTKKGGVYTNLFLVGEPGVGKTELVKGVAQQFKEKTIFALNAPELSSSYTSPGDLMRLILLDVKGHENKVVFFIDEFGDAIKKNPKANLSGYLKPLLGADGVQVIAALTSEEYQEIILKDKPLAERFTKIEVKRTKKNQTIEILQERIDSKRKSIRFAPDAAEKIYKATKKQLQPRNAVILLNLAINRVSAFDINQYVPDALQDVKTKLQFKQKSYQASLAQGGTKKGKIAKDIIALKEKAERLEKKAEAQKKLALKTRRFIQSQKKFLLTRDRLIKENPSEKMLPFLHCYLLPWMQKKATSLVKKIKDIPMQVDGTLINEIMKEKLSEPN